MKLLAILLLALPLAAQNMLMLASKASSGAALDCSAAATNIPQTPSGGSSTSFSLSGTNNIVTAFLWIDTSAPTSVKIDATTAMTLVTSHASSAGGTAIQYIYQAVGVSAGSHTVDIVAAGQTIGSIVTASNAKQTGQPDSFTFTSGTSDGSSEIGLDLTTVAPGTCAVGNFESGVNVINTPSSNGTYKDGLNFGNGFIWASTANISGTGAFSLKAKGTSGPGIAYQVLGVSIAPL